MKTLKIHFFILTCFQLFIFFACSKKTDSPNTVNTVNMTNLNQQIRNQIAFTKLFGYIRYFHPSTETEKINWDKFAVYGASFINNMPDDSSLVSALSKIYKPIAPSIHVYTTNSIPELYRKEITPTDTTGWEQIFYKHYGVGILKDDWNIYYSVKGVFNKSDTNFGKLTKLPEAGKFYTFKIIDNISVSFPIALFSQDDKTFPQGDINSLKNLLSSIDTLQDYTNISKAEVRLSYVNIAWNILQHFYPYFEVVKTDWENTLSRSIKDALTDSSEVQFSFTIKRLAADLHDGHGFVNVKETEDIFAPDFDWEFLENHIVAVSSNEKEIEPGDIIEEINGITTLSAIDSCEKFISGSTSQWKKSVSNFYNNSVIMVMLGKKEEMKLKLKKKSGETKEVTVARNHVFNRIKKPVRPQSLREINPGIIYIDLSASTIEEINGKMEILEKAKGIIFDMRGYPKGNHEILQHLTVEHMTSAMWCVPLTVFPDRQNVEFEISDRWEMPPLKPRLKAKVVFLTNARAISYAESVMGIVEAYKLGEIIGERTAGTNGNINRITFSNGWSITFTGMKVLKHDGSRHHGIGINPTIQVSPTINGYLEDKDEQLEKAVELLSK